MQQPLVVWDDLKCPPRCSEPRFHREKLLTEAAPSVKMRLSRPAGRDKREISIEVPLKNGQSKAETIQIVLLFKRLKASVLCVEKCIFAQVLCVRNRNKEI